MELIMVVIFCAKDNTEHLSIFAEGCVPKAACRRLRAEGCEHLN